MCVCAYRYICISSVQSFSHVWLSATPWTAAHQASLSITNSQSLPKPMSIVSVMPSNHLIFCRPLPLLPSIFPSIMVFQVSQLSICVYIQRNITLPLKVWNTAISVTWIDPEIIIPNELIRKRKRNIIWYHLHTQFKKRY